MGNGFYCIEAVSQHCFKKLANKLTPFQVSAIASILPNPRKYKVNSPSLYIKNNLEWTILKMPYLEPLDLNTKQ